MKFKFLLLAFLTFSIRTSYSQTLEFSNSKKKFFIGKYYSASFVLKNGTKSYGTVDTVTEKEIIIHRWENNGYIKIPIKVDDIAIIKKCKSFLCIGPRFHLFRICKKRHLKDYKYVLKNK